MDNSGGSAGGVLDLYGQEWSEEDKMEKINNFRMRMLKCMNNDSRQIDTAIMYKDSVERGMVDELKARGIEPFLKVDQGVEENGTLKIFPVHEICEWAVEKGCTGTKMRSIVKDETMVDAVVAQQFALAKVIRSYNLMPIVEPEVPIHANNKQEIENKLIQSLVRYLDDSSHVVMLKLTLPSIPGRYDSLNNHRGVERIVALSGGYSTQEACGLLKKNQMSASFSRGLSEGLKYNMTDEEFNDKITSNINLILDACDET
jgi:fructose-bisphosphate aldolase class I